MCVCQQDTGQVGGDKRGSGRAAAGLLQSLSQTTFQAKNNRLRTHTHPISFSRCSTQRHLCELIVDRKTCGLAKHWHAFCQRLKTRRKKLKPPARHIKVSGRHKFMLACNFAQHQHTSLPT